MRMLSFLFVICAAEAAADSFVVCSPSRFEVALGSIRNWIDGETYLRLSPDGEVSKIESKFCNDFIGEPIVTGEYIQIGCSDNLSLHKWTININRITGAYYKMSTVNPYNAVFTVEGTCRLQSQPKF